MGQWLHRLSDIDPDTRTGVCAVCGPGKLKNKGKSRAGAQQWACYNAWNLSNYQRKSAQTHRKFVGNACANPSCTATIDHRIQLDVHHIDGNHKNNDLDNLQTLCANCHRLDMVGLL